MDMYDLLLAKKLGGGGGGGVTVEELDVSANNTYTAPEGKAYSPVVVNVPQTTVTELNATANGTYNAGAGAAYNPVVVNVSGGLTNVARGTFTATASDTAYEITTTYTGSGYPIALSIWPSEGSWCTGGSYRDLVKRYAIGFYALAKTNIGNAPTYTGADTTYDGTSINYWYKSSSSDASQLQAGSTNLNMSYNDVAGGSGSNNTVKIRSKTKISVFIIGTAYGYGFAPNVEYSYCVVYSS